MQAQAPDVPAPAPAKKRTERPRKELSSLGQAVAEVCQMDPATVDSKRFWQIDAAASALAKAGHTADEIRALFGADGKWYWGFPGLTSDGTRTAPRIDQVRNDIGRVRAMTRGNGNGHARGSPPRQDNDAWANMDPRAIIESNKVKGARHE